MFFLLQCAMSHSPSDGRRRGFLGNLTDLLTSVPVKHTRFKLMPNCLLWVHTAVIGFLQISSIWERQGILRCLSQNKHSKSAVLLNKTLVFFRFGCLSRLLLLGASPWMCGICSYLITFPHQWASCCWYAGSLWMVLIRRLSCCCSWTDINKFIFFPYVTIWFGVQPSTTRIYRLKTAQIVKDGRQTKKWGQHLLQPQI